MCKYAPWVSRMRFKRLGHAPWPTARERHQKGLEHSTVTRTCHLISTVLQQYWLALQCCRRLRQPWVYI